MTFPTCAVIPVMDLMIGQIVLAQGGDRGAYLPVHSKLTHSSNPLDVANSMFQQTGCESMYLADIDSFAGARPNWQVYNEILNRGFGLWVDADWIQENRIQQIAGKIDRPDRLKLILSSETMSSPEQFETFGELQAQGIQSIFSLDVKAGSVITQPGKLEEAEPLELVQMARQHGVGSLIILDLDSVGTMQGGDESDRIGSLIESVRSEMPEMRLISGGGIRDESDIQALLDRGCQHVLVASAIHQCSLTPYEIGKLIPSSVPSVS